MPDCNVSLVIYNFIIKIKIKNLAVKSKAKCPPEPKFRLRYLLKFRFQISFVAPKAQLFENHLKGSKYPLEMSKFKFS